MKQEVNLSELNSKLPPSFLNQDASQDCLRCA